MGTPKRERQKAGRNQARIEQARIAQAEARKRQIRNLVIIVAVFVVIVGGIMFSKRNEGSTVDAGSSNTTSPTLTPPGSTPEGTGPTTSSVAGAVPAEAPAPGPGAEIKGDTPCPAADGSSPRTTKFAKAPPMCIDSKKTYTATFETNKGNIKVALDAAKMPSTTNNFVVLSRYHYYDGTALFRTAPSIAIIQGGAPTNSASDPGPGYNIPDEGGQFDFSPTAPHGGKGPFTYEQGELVMARSPGPNSSGSQFFLTTGPEVVNLNANGTYLLFGKITEGNDVAHTIIGLHADYPASDPRAQLGGGPREAVIVNKLTITES